ncbi:MAG: outer membrane protein assembly factor BamB family protein [Planctomycetota bacterium]|jgi:hypothetical protein
MSGQTPTVLYDPDDGKALTLTYKDAVHLWAANTAKRFTLLKYKQFNNGSGYSIVAVDTTGNAFAISGNHVSDFGWKPYRYHIYIDGSSVHNGRYWLDEDNPAWYDSGTDWTWIPVTYDLTDSTADGAIYARLTEIFNVYGRCRAVAINGTDILVVTDHDKGQKNWAKFRSGYMAYGGQEDLYCTHPDGGAAWSPDHGTYNVNDYAYIPEGDLNAGYRSYGAWYKCKTQHSSSSSEFPPTSNKWALAIAMEVWCIDSQTGKVKWTCDAGNDLYDICVDSSGNVYFAGDVSVPGQQTQHLQWLDGTSALSGQWRLCFNNEWTDYMPVTASFGEIQEQLDALPSLEPGDITVYWKTLPSVTYYQWMKFTIKAAGHLRYRGQMLIDNRLLKGKRYEVQVDGFGETTDEDGDTCNVWKLNSSGEKQWSYNTGGRVHAIAVDSSGNVYIAGSVGSDDKNLWKLNSSGSKIWSQKVTHPVYTDLDIITSMVLSLTTGDIYLTVGEDYGTLCTQRRKSSDGSQVWVAGSGSGVILGHSLAMRSDGEWYIQGETQIARQKEVNVPPWQVQQVWNSSCFRSSYKTHSYYTAVFVDGSDNPFVTASNSNLVGDWDVQKFDGSNGNKLYCLRNFAIGLQATAVRGCMGGNDNEFYAGYVRPWFGFLTYTDDPND